MAYTKIHAITATVDKAAAYICNPDKTDEKIYIDCKQTYYRIRKLSDELCSEHNLSVIIPGGERSKKYNEWQTDKNGTSWKTQIRKDINAAIKASSTYEEFLILMRAKGYEIKGETFGEDAPRYISFRPLGKDRFVRGSVKSLGTEFTKERIKERMEMKRERKAVIPKRDYANRKLVDTTDEKFHNSPGLQRWAAIENLKIAAQAYNEAGSIKELEQKIAATAAIGKEAKQTVRKLENRIKDLAEIIKCAEQYKANKSYNIPTKRLKTPKHISAGMRARLSFMAAQGVCWSRRA